MQNEPKAGGINSSKEIQSSFYSNSNKKKEMKEGRKEGRKGGKVLEFYKLNY